MRRSDQAPYVDERQTSGATDLEAFLAGGDSEALLRAAAIVIECELPLTRACRRNLEADGREHRDRKLFGRRPCGQALVRYHG